MEPYLDVTGCSKNFHCNHDGSVTNEGRVFVDKVAITDTKFQQVLGIVLDFSRGVFIIGYFSHDRGKDINKC